MKKFAQDVLALVVILVLLNLVCYKFITFSLLYQDYENLFSKLLHQTEYKTFILSDSHGWSLTLENPEVEELLQRHGIYNLSYGSDSYGDILIKLKWLINNEIPVDTIILTVDDHMLTKKSNNQNRNIAYSNPEWHKIAYGVSLPKYLFYKVNKYFPLFYPSNQRLIKEAFKSKIQITTTKNAIDTTKMWQALSLEERRQEIKSRMNAFFPNKEFTPKKKLEENLEQIIDLSQRNTITVIGIKFPTDSIMIQETINIGAVEYVKQKASDLGINRFLDYQYKYADPKYLGNQDHVNQNGARQIAHDIITDLRNH